MEVYASTISGTVPENIPEAMRKRPQWMGTVFARRKGRPDKLDKPPYRVREGLPVIKADKTNPENWSTFEEAVKALQEGRVESLGYVITPEDPLYLADFDRVRDLETGEVNGSALELIHTHATYAEWSCSGEGVHVIGEGRKPEYSGCKSDRLGFDAEVYDAARFVVLTGDKLSGTPAEPQPRQEELDALCRRLWPKREKFARRPRSSSPVDLEDEQLLDRARRARSTGAKFRKLYDLGDASGYPSPSEADYALLNLLIFWCAGDGERIEKLFEASALFRAKEKHRGYVRRSVERALATYVGKFYRPRRVRAATEKADPLAPYLTLLLTPAAWTGRRAASAYKCFCACVVEAAENGIVDDAGNLRIRCDTRTLAETAGTRQATVCQSGLPYLIQDMKLIRWRRSAGGGRQSGTLVLSREAVEKCVKRINQISTHLIDTLSDTPKHTLETLRLLVRMRRGSSQTATLLRLGMVPMFATIALLGGPSRGQSLGELVKRTGRRKADVREALGKLKAAQIVREAEPDVFRLAEEYAARYERHLRASGVLAAERSQRRRHAEDRARRDRRIPLDKQDRKLRGKRHMEKVVREGRRREREKTPPRERPLTVAEVAEELRRFRSGPQLALAHYLREPSEKTLRWLTNAVLLVWGRDRTRVLVEAHESVVKRAAGDPDNHPHPCECRKCA